MSDQDFDQPQPKPAPENYATWNDYWTKANNQPWRTEPEIEGDQQCFLAERRSISADPAHAIYPFRDSSGSIKLDRADVEWLLATHVSEGIQGPVDWADKKQRQRTGIDLRGADLKGASLQKLPLARLVAGFEHMAAYEAPRRERFLATVHLEGADLSEAHLERALLGRARLEGADLSYAVLCGADLYGAHLEGVNLSWSHLGGAILRGAYFERSTVMELTFPYDDEFGAFRVFDARWGGINLASLRWEQVDMLGDERHARQSQRPNGEQKLPARRLIDFERAVRANRQVALELRAQGLNELADRYAYRAQLLQRSVNRRQGHPVRALGSWLLDVISGYGYKPMRSVITYIIVILSFAAAYFALTNFAITPFLPSHSSPLAWYEALVLSVSSFHGRGLFPTGLSLGDPVAILAAFEAIIGLLIEITFIATFTQRFFAR